MAGDRFSVLSGVTRLAGGSTASPARAINKILRFVADSLQLPEPAFFLFDPRRRRFTRVLHPSGPDLLLSSPGDADRFPETAVFRQGRPAVAADRFCLPVGDASPCGVLSFASDNPPDKELHDLLGAVGAVLAGLSRQLLTADAQQRRDRQLALHFELAAALNRAGSRSDVLRAAITAVQRRTGAVGVILRPLYGGTLLGRSQVRVAPAWRQSRRLMLELEEEHAALALSGRIPLLFEGSGGVRAASHGLPAAMAVVPLFWREQPMGTLTLFGGTAEDTLPLGPDEETVRFLAAVGAQIAQAMERAAAQERLAELGAEHESKLREVTLLYRVARAMHSTLRLNELIHLVLSAATAPEGGGFERAMLFMLNERSGVLQGMLCVTRDTAALVLPPDQGPLAWERPNVSSEVLEAQRRSPCCRQVMQQRLPLDGENALSRAARRGRVVFVARPEAELSSGAALAETLDLAPFACAPLLGRERPLGVLLVDNPQSREAITPDRRRFLELFASQAGAAMENALLLHRLETTHHELREIRERLIQGEKLAVLGEMAASIAHEIKNPLVSIGGFAQRLARDAAGDREREYAGIIAREVRRMEEMLSNILAFAKQQMLCIGECDLGKLIDEALTLEIDALTRASVRLETDIMPRLPVVQADEQKLRQVLLNLITNARQVMAQGGGLTVRAYRLVLRGEDAVAVEVADTGGGIPEEILSSIFDPFFTTKEQGTGLGLSISRRIIEQHRGEIEVRNRGPGAVFILRLPVRAVAPFR